MSLIIKGMEMPQAGDMIICGQIDGKLQCTIVTRGKPTKWCEASEVSAPHGRLIDCESDFFPTAFRYNSTDYARGWNTCLKSVLLSSTIIEAEENDEK